MSRKNVSVSERLEGLTPPELNDDQLEVLDETLSSVEDMLSRFPVGRNCYSRFVADAFLQHVRVHLAVELQNIAAHDHRNDDAHDEPPPSIYARLVQLAEQVAAGNTEFEGLEHSAKTILEEIGQAE